VTVRATVLHTMAAYESRTAVLHINAAARRTDAEAKHIATCHC